MWEAIDNARTDAETKSTVCHEPRHTYITVAMLSLPETRDAGCKRVGIFFFWRWV